MGKRGPKPKNKIRIKWSPDFAYAIGLLTTDGNLSSDGRHISFTSKDLEQVKNLNKSLGIDCGIGRKSSGSQKLKKYFVVQIGDVLFYKFLLQIGLMPRKSKIISEIKIPHKYFFDFLRGHFDGDGTFYSYWDPRWHSSFMFYTAFISASRPHIKWIDNEIYKLINIRGRITQSDDEGVYCLRYAKADSLKLLPKMYYSNNITYLSRKFDKIKKALKTEAVHNKSDQ